MGLYEQLDEVDVSVLGGEVEGGDALLALGAHVRVVLQQQLRHGVVAVLSRQVQGSLALLQSNTVDRCKGLRPRHFTNR